jgi:hypothetical protein
VSAETVIGSAFVYSGPHYGRRHKVTGKTAALTWVEYRGNRFAVPHCDVEMIEDATPSKGKQKKGATR